VNPCGFLLLSDRVLVSLEKFAAKPEPDKAAAEKRSIF